LIDNRQLDAMGFPPFGVVTEGMAVVDSLYAGYGDGPPSGFGPDQFRLIAEGNGYLAREFPKLDFIRTARVIGRAVADSAATP
jgi:peptidyl-prolyl cis-trans isomerase A (cyclophilin A)